MTEPSSLPDALPAPRPGRRFHLSAVWAIPIVAALIGAWMTFKALTRNGPEVVISFLGAEGLEAGRTRIKYKDVDVGTVTAIRLQADRTRVLVKAQLTREATGLVSSNSRFWVVRARIGVSGVSGLGTLLSGAYIGMDPGQPGSAQRAFTGLETPPIVTTHQEGAVFTLRSERLGSLNIGSAVNFRQIRVGEVAGYDLDKDGKSVSISIFIHAPYHTLVSKDTRFWNTGGMDLTLDGSGVRLSSDSLVDMLLGGIAFENPVSLSAPEPAPGGFVFPLYPSHEKIYEKVYLTKQYFVMNFSESVRGLGRGAPVEFRGIRIGQVEDLKLEFHTEKLTGEIPVLIAIEPERLSVIGRESANMETILEKLVERGLRGQLKMGSLLTGSLFVDLDFYPKDPARTLQTRGRYREIPTIPTTMGAMMANLNHFLDKVQSLPLDELVTEFRSTIPALRGALIQTQELAARLDKETVPKVQATLDQARLTLGSLEKTLRADSPVQEDLRRSLDEFSKAARALKDLADTLERNPESIVWGKKKQKAPKEK